jgi:hypothetical protein
VSSVVEMSLAAGSQQLRTFTTETQSARENSMIDYPLDTARNQLKEG